MRSRTRTGLIVAGGLVLLIVVLILVWDWNWFRPMVEARASASLGRPVTIGRLHVRLGRTTQVTLDDVAVDNPKDFGGTTAPPATAPSAATQGANTPTRLTPANLASEDKFARIAHLTVRIGLLDYIFHHHLVLPLIDIEQPEINAQQLANGQSNWSTGKSSNSGKTSIPDIGDLRIVDGTARVRIPRLKADFNLGVATQPPGSAQSSSGGQGTQAGNPDNQIIVTAKGTYAAQKIVGKFVGGALLSLRDARTPYPIDLNLANGATTVSLVGTVQNPLAFSGARLKLKLAGQDMSALYPLTGVPIPQTPPYHVAGNLDYENHKIRFRDFEGVVGKSDLGGTIQVDPRTGGPRPLVIADLHSRSVDLDDLAGFIGGTPGNKSTPGTTASQKQQIAKAAHSDRLLPETRINIPKLLAADVQLAYKGAHIQGKYVPFDNIVVALDIDDGDIRLHPLDFKIGTGTLASTISLREKNKLLHTVADIDFEQIDLGRIMQATHAFGGGGTIGGGAKLTTTGNSLSEMLGNGNGSLRFNMAGGGNLSALLQDLSGLQLGDAFLSSLGIPNKATIRCLRSDFTLQDGTLNTNVLALDTTEAVTRGKGTVDFKDEKVAYVLQTKPVRFSVGTLHAPINITGTLKKPSILPDVPTLAARAGAAVGLGILFPPLALIPTIQLGVGNNTACQLLAGAD